MHEPCQMTIYDRYKGVRTGFQNTEMLITFLKKYHFTVVFFPKHQHRRFLLHPKYLYVSQGRQTKFFQDSTFNEIHVL